MAKADKYLSRFKNAKEKTFEKQPEKESKRAERSLAKVKHHEFACEAYA